MSDPDFERRRRAPTAGYEVQPTPNASPNASPDALIAASPEISANPDETPRRELIRRRLFGDPDVLAEALTIGRFVVLHRVGEGAMSVVYAAHDRELDRKVAIKLLRADLSTPGRAARLRREAQALARVSDTNVIAIHDVGQWNGRVFLAMEFVPGCTLAVWQHGEARSWRDIVNVYAQAGRGLAAAHAANLVHRDFKPANVLVGDDGRVRVVDFGLVGAEPTESGGAVDDVDVGASASGSASASAPGSASSWARRVVQGDLTATRASLGTPAYMAPEQFVSARVDGRADQFSFCVALHEALYGRRPFEARDPDGTLDDIRIGPAAASRLRARLPRRLPRILRRGLATDPRERYPSMTALLADIERVAGARRRRRCLALAVLGFAAMALVALGTARWYGQGLERERARTLCAKAVAAAEKVVGSDATHAAVLLRDAPCADDDPRWAAAASGTLQLPVATMEQRGRWGRATRVGFNLDGRYLAVSFANDITELWPRAPDGSLQADRVIERPGWLFRFSARGHQLLTLSRDNTVRVWDLNRNQDPDQDPLGTLLVSLDNEETVVSADFLPDDVGVSWLTSGGTLRVWRPGQGESREQIVLQHGFASIRSTILGADRRHIVIKDHEREFQLWRVTWSPLGAERIRLRLPSIQLSSIPENPCRARTEAIPANARYLYVGCMSGALMRWDLDHPGPPEVWSGHSATIESIHVLPDGRVLSVSKDGTTRLWTNDETNAKTNNAKRRSDIIGRHDGSARASVSQNGRRVLIVSATQVQVLDLDLSLSRDATVLRNANGLILYGALSPDGHHTVVINESQQMRGWDLRRKNSQVLRGHEQGIWSAELDARGVHLATASFDGTVRLWDLSGREPPRVFRDHGAAHVYTARFDPRGECIATGANDGSARIWCAHGREPMVLPGHEVWAYAVAWSPNGEWLATGAQTGVVRLWNVARGEPLVLAPPKSSSRIHALTFSGDGTRLAALNADGLVRMWHLSATAADTAPTMTQFPMTQFQDAQRIGHAMKSSPDGRLFAVGDGSDAVLLDSRDLSVVARCQGHDSAIYDVAFSPDGSRLVTASDDGTARVWRADCRREHTFYGDSAWMTTAAFDTAGERVVTGSQDGVVRVWRLDTPDTPIVLRGHTDEVRFVAFTPDGERVITAARDGTARVWTLPARTGGASLRRKLRDTTTVCLSPGRIVQYLGLSEAEARRITEACYQRGRSIRAKRASAETTRR